MVLGLWRKCLKGVLVYFIKKIRSADDDPSTSYLNIRFLVVMYEKRVMNYPKTSEKTAIL